MKNHLNKIESPAGNEGENNSTRAQRVNRAAALATIVLSLIALPTVLSGYLQPPQPRETDEGTAAHIFQLSIAALFPSLLLFLATADWKQPARSARPLVVPAAALTIAFATLFYLEHYR
jgi:cytochrome bd-type quinol oxidase subunit 2